MNNFSLTDRYGCIAEILINSSIKPIIWHTPSRMPVYLKIETGFGSANHLRLFFQTDFSGWNLTLSTKLRKKETAQIHESKKDVLYFLLQDRKWAYVEKRKKSTMLWDKPEKEKKTSSISLPPAPISSFHWVLG